MDLIVQAMRRRGRLIQRRATIAALVDSLPLRRTTVFAFPVLNLYVVLGDIGMPANRGSRQTSNDRNRTC